MIKNFFALVGFVVVALYILGTFGIGNFTFYYGPDQKVCFNKNSIQLKIEEHK